MSSHHLSNLYLQVKSILASQCIAVYLLHHYLHVHLISTSKCHLHCHLVHWLVPTISASKCIFMFALSPSSSSLDNYLQIQPAPSLIISMFTLSHPPSASFSLHHLHLHIHLIAICKGSQHCLHVHFKGHSISWSLCTSLNTTELLPCTSPSALEFHLYHDWLYVYFQINADREFIPYYVVNYVVLVKFIYLSKITWWHSPKIASK